MNPLPQLFRRSLVLLSFLLPAFSQAAPYSIPSTDVRALPHSANGHDYVLYVWVPDSYKTSPTKKYPVVYICDGYWDFPLFTAEAGNLIYDQMMPECILVGIGYAGTTPDVGALRQYDLTPGKDPGDPSGSTTGHAAEFLSVIEKQIIPYVESEYRSDSTFRVLTGSSFGGLFVVYSVFARPELFNGYIAPSPSLWWRGREQLQVAEDALAKRTSLNVRLFLSWGSEESYSITGSTAKFYENLQQHKLSGFAFTAREITGERHAGPKGESFNRGLRFVFQGRAPAPSSAADPGFKNPSPLINVSTRGTAGTGEKALIAGFVIRGRDPKKVLVRGIGPGLSFFGITTPLANPSVRVMSSAKDELVRNDDWGTAPNSAELTSATYLTGAFPLSTGSKDAALVTTLAPGTYTAIVESADSTTGVALVEVYEVTP